MNPIIRKTILAGMVLATSAAFAAEVVVDDFTGTNPGTNMLPEGGAWLADADTWPSIGGSSRVVDPVEGSDLVKGDAFAGDNIVKAYTEDNAITSKIYVTKDVSPAKKWAYAGWVMDFIVPKPTDTTKPVYELNSWEKGQEVDISSCDTMELTLQFDATRLLWIDLFNPGIEKSNALAPQYGWRYTGTGALETKKFRLKGVTGPGQKWKDDVNKVPFNLAGVSRIRWLYEGMMQGVATASYDTLPHTLKIKKVAFSGATCQIKPNRFTGSPIIGTRNASASRGVSFSAANGSLNFRDVTAPMQVTVRNLAGNVVAEGTVNGSQPSMNVSALNNGVYMVQAVAGKAIRAGSITLLK